MEVTMEEVRRFPADTALSVHVGVFGETVPPSPVGGAVAAAAGGAAASEDAGDRGEGSGSEGTGAPTHAGFGGSAISCQSL